MAEMCLMTPGVRQSAAVLLDPTIIHVTLPAADCEVIPGVPWGTIEAFPTPAYWVYQVMARRIGGRSPSHRLGATLAEEVAACLLGGHGIPAQVGLAAFQSLKLSGMLTGVPVEAEVFQRLSQPLDVDGRPVRHRFARQKAYYVSAALSRLAVEQPPLTNGRALRDWLVQSPGIGHKTASWVARNWLEADDVAILDIHVVRAGWLTGFFDAALSPERNYLELEEQFICFAHAIGVRPSELDAVIWFEMMSSPRTVSRLMGGLRSKSGTWQWGR